jgi:hypothetical protein
MAVINLLTGVPGSGKSFYTFDHLIKQHSDREIYFLNFDGVSSFLDEHKNFHNLNWITKLFHAHSTKNINLASKIITAEKKKGHEIKEEYVTKLKEIWDSSSSQDAIFQITEDHTDEVPYPSIENWCPKGSVLIIDEAQTFFRNDVKGCNFFNFLDTARHTGYNIYFTTPNSMLLAPNCRRHIGEHLYFDKPIGILYFRLRRYQGIQNDSSSKNFIGNKNYIEKKMIFYVFKNDVFKKYKSSEKEKTKLSFPLSRIIFLFILIAFSIFLIHFVITKLSPDEEQEVPVILPNNEEEQKGHPTKEPKTITVKYKKEIHLPLTHRGIGDTYCDVSIYDIQIIGLIQIGNNRQFLVLYEEKCHTLKENKDGKNTAPITESNCHQANINYLYKYGYRYRSTKNSIIIWREDIKETRFYMVGPGQKIICETSPKNEGYRGRKFKTKRK